jgi:type II secretory pathway pseudopilin PulG
MTKSLGYSIIEILVVFLIMGVLLFAGFANLRDFSRRQEINGAHRQIVSDLVYTQSASASGKKTGGCTGDLDGYKFRIDSTQNPAKYSILAVCDSDVLIKETTLPRNIRLSLTGFNVDNSFIFRSVARGTDITRTSIYIDITHSQLSGLSSRVIIGRAGDVQ